MPAPRHQFLFDNWREELGHKWILLDAVAINIMVSYQATDLLRDLKSVSTCVYIHPVLLELMRTDNKKLLAPRLALLGLCIELPFDRLVLGDARSLQEDLYREEVRPSPTDLYLGAALKKFHNMYLLTENIKDFPEPHFERVGYVAIPYNKGTRFLTILKSSQ